MRYLLLNIPRELERDFGLGLLERQLDDLQVGDDLPDTVYSFDERDDQVAVEFVVDCAVERHDPIFDIEVDATYVRQFEVAFEGAVQPQRQRFTFERPARIAYRRSAQAACDPA